MSDTTDPAVPLWQRLNRTWVEANARLNARAKVANRKSGSPRNMETLTEPSIDRLEDWFGGPIPNIDALSQAGIVTLLECSASHEEPNKSLNEDDKAIEDHLIEAIWWLHSYRINKSLNDLSRSSAKWRKARFPETAIEISADVISERLSNRPYLEWVLTSHAAALCDVYRKTRDRSLLHKAVELDKRAIVLSPEERHAYLQLHRAYGLLGMVEEAIRAVERAAAQPNHRPEFGDRIVREILVTWPMIRSERWGQQYRNSVFRAIANGSLPEIKDLPF